MTTRVRCAAARAVCALLALGLCGGAYALRSGKTADGRAYVSGGVGQEELSGLHQRRANYSLWVITAAAGSGAYLADVRVVVRDQRGRSVFDDRLDGPWLFIDLPLGRYEIEARMGDASQRHVTTIHADDRHQAFFYFDTGDDVPQERYAPPSGNPYDGSRR